MMASTASTKGRPGPRIAVPLPKAMPELPSIDTWGDSDSESEETGAEFKALDPVRTHFRRALARNASNAPTPSAPLRLRKYKKLPANFTYLETDRAYSLVDGIVHRHYRGSDIMSFPWVNDNVDKRFFAMVGIGHYDYDTKRYASISQWGANVGCPIKQGQRVMITPNLDTQWPSLSVFVKRDNGRTVECRIFGSECDTFSVDGPSGRVDDWWFEADSEQFAQKSNNKLLQFTWQIRVGAKVAWGGITAEEISSMTEQWFTDHPADRLLAQLQSEFTGSATITVPDKVDPEPFSKYFRALMNTAIEHGNLWFWHLQHPEQRMTVRNFLLDGVDSAPPRWLVKEWLAIPASDGSGVEKVVPVKWACFSEPGVWPDEITTNAIYRLDLARCRPINDVALRAGLDKQAGDIISTWMPYKQTVDEAKSKGYYLVNVWCSFSTSAINGKALCPERNTPVTIQVLTDNGRFHHGKYFGFVVPDVMLNGCAFAVFVYGDIGVPERCTSETGIVHISVDIDINSVSVDRMMGACIELGVLTRNRKPGSMEIDFGRFFMGFPATPGCGGTFAATMESEQLEHIVRINRKRGANDRQLDFVREVCSNRDGVVYLNGPPGTGKSRSIANLSHSIVDTNRFYRQNEKHTILVTAPTNKAVESLLRKLVEDDPDCEERVVVHFQGAASKTGAGHDSAEQSVPEGMPKDAESAVWEMLDFWSTNEVEDGNLGRYSFQRVFLRWYTEAAAEELHPMQSFAKKYADAVRRLRLTDKQIGGRKGKLTGPAAAAAGKLERVRLRESKEEDEQTLMQYFFAYYVDILCSTMNSAGHPKLRATCQATIAILDEAGVSTTPDILNPLVANSKTLQAVILAGDHKQQRPMVQNQGQNEFAQVHPASLLEDIAVREGDSGKVPLMKRIVLQVQYRMPPDIMDLVNSLVYDDQLQSDQSVLADQDQATLAKQVFSNLGPCFKKEWNYFAVSVSGEDVCSEAFTNTTSLMNVFEAEAVVQTALKLVGHEGHEMSDVAGGSINARNILVITPYSGQASLLWTRFREVGLITDVEADSARINSFAQVQGDEELIVLVSFCTNIPERELAIQFAVEEHGLTVALSRARAFLVLFGNFKTWAEGKINNVDGFFPNRKFKMLHQLLELLCEQEDPAACRIVSMDNYNTFLEDKQPTTATFLDSLVEHSVDQPRAGGGKRKSPNDGFQAVEADGRRRAGQNKKAKGSRAAVQRSGGTGNALLEQAIAKEASALKAELAALTTMSSAEVAMFYSRWSGEATHQRLGDAMRALVDERYFALKAAKPLAKQAETSTQPRANATQSMAGHFLPRKDDGDRPAPKGKERQHQPGPQVQMPGEFSSTQAESSYASAATPAVTRREWNNARVDET
jgi:hypothetical protein